jgi:hypothetical protein
MRRLERGRFARFRRRRFTAEPGARMTKRASDARRRRDEHDEFGLGNRSGFDLDHDGGTL